MGARRGGGGQGGHLPPLEFEKMTSYAAVLQNTLKFSLAPSALPLDTLCFSLKRREKTQKFSFAPSARRKMVDLLYGAPKTCRLFKVSVILPPLEKFLRAPMTISGLLLQFPFPKQRYCVTPATHSMGDYLLALIWTSIPISFHRVSERMTQTNLLNSTNDQKIL